MKSLLLVEDDQIIIKAYEKKLTSEGFTVKIASTGDEALNLLSSEKFDLVILDLMLPGGKHGFDVLEIMKKDPATSQIPVIVLTNLDSEEKTAREIGASAYLVKSNTSLEEVVKKIKTLLK
jgi:DNA-binding response OmpR family regulator